MKTALLALTLAGFALAPHVGAHERGKHEAATPAAPAGDSTEPAVAIVDAFSAALKAGDMARVGQLLADDVLILESGGAERSRAEYLGHHAISDAAFLAAAHSQLRHRTVRVDGDVAWVGSESELHAQKDGKPMTLLSTETMVLKRTGADWHITHIHWSSRPKR